MLRKAVSVLLLCVPIFLSGQSNSSNYQSALILKVKEHHGAIPENIRSQIKDPSAVHYDISIRIKSTKEEYVLLYTPLPGKYGFQYMAGWDLLVLVENTTVTFNDMMGRSIKVPILARGPAPSHNKP
jgi:hypothetical protein